MLSVVLTVNPLLAESTTSAVMAVAAAQKSTASASFSLIDFGFNDLGFIATSRAVWGWNARTTSWIVACQIDSGERMTGVIPPHRDRRLAENRQRGLISWTRKSLHPKNISP